MQKVHNRTRPCPSKDLDEQGDPKLSALRLTRCPLITGRMSACVEPGTSDTWNRLYAARATKVLSRQKPSSPIILRRHFMSYERDQGIYYQSYCIPGEPTR